MDTLQALAQYGALGICLAYFIYKDNVTSKELKATLEKFNETMVVIKEIMGGCRRD